MALQHCALYKKWVAAASFHIHAEGGVGGGGRVLHRIQANLREKTPNCLNSTQNI